VSSPLNRPSWLAAESSAKGGGQRVTREEWDECKYTEEEEEWHVEEKPSSSSRSGRDFWVPVDDVGFTQNSISPKFTDGKEFEDLIQGLLCRRIKLSEQFLRFPVVKIAGHWHSANNRRLYCVKQYQERLRKLGGDPDEVVEVCIVEKGSVTKQVAKIIKQKYSTKDRHEITIR